MKILNVCVVEDACKECGMWITIKKLIVMIISRNQNVPIPISKNGKILEGLHYFKYLGNLINAKDPVTEIKARVEQATSNFIFKRTILTLIIY